MKQLRKSETTKLFYDEFPYKLVINNSLRVSNPRMNVYSHDRDWLLMLSVKINSACEFYEPSKQHLSMLSKNVILLDTIPEYEYKITLGDRCDSNLANWIVNNPDKAKAGPVCLSTIARGAYTNGLYFYARDEKILQLLNKPVSCNRINCKCALHSCYARHTCS